MIARRQAAKSIFTSHRMRSCFRISVPPGRSAPQTQKVCGYSSRRLVLPPFTGAAAHHWRSRPPLMAYVIPCLTCLMASGRAVGSRSSCRVSQAMMLGPTTSARPACDIRPYRVESDLQRHGAGEGVICFRLKFGTRRGSLMRLARPEGRLISPSALCRRNCQRQMI